jgi:hypothetical protein
MLILTKTLMSILLVGTGLFSQYSKALIYGKVTMRDGEVYQGVIRWGDDEALWDDTFNATKTENPYKKYLEREDFEEIEDEDRVSFFGLKFSWNKRLDTHQFVCFFGDIKKIMPDGKSYAVLLMKNGEKFEVERNGEDIGLSIKIIDSKEGQKKLKWRQIDEIEFMQAPESIKEDFGKPLIAKVITSYGDFEGSVQWEEGEEGLDTDKLDGENRETKDDEKIKFSEIRSVRFSSRRYSTVELKSGETMELGGTNDVDSDHRGLIVKDPRYGWLKIKRKEIDKVIFNENYSILKSYDDYQATKELEATVFLESGTSISGRIVYDMDESLDFELLDGSIDDTEYRIPFRDISKIVPRNRYGSEVILKNGIKLRLEESQDVSKRNTGILVWTDRNKPEFVPWKKIKAIEFK